MVIDRDTGATPPSAAERMAEHDRRMGHEPTRAAPRETVAVEAAPTEAPAPARLPAPKNDRLAAAVADMNRKRPWKDNAKPTVPKPARPAQRTQPQGAALAGGRKTIVTGKWWDAKGPRTIELGAQGQRELTSGFMTLFFVAVIASIVALFIQPVIFFAVAFLLFRFGGQILGPIGAGIIDKAIAERN